MNTIRCNEFLDWLGDWIEGDRSAEARAHLRACTQCRLLVADLEAIAHTAPSVAADDPEPSPRVWLALRAQLEQEGLIHESHPDHSHGLAGWIDGIFAMIPRPAFAAAYLAVLVALGVALSGPRATHENDAHWLDTETSTNTLSAQLDTAEQDTFVALQDADPAVTASLHKNLAVVDNYIALCEKSVREDPQDETARDYLYDAYQQKADLLAQMSDRGDDGQ